MLSFSTASKIVTIWNFLRLINKLKVLKHEKPKQVFCLVTLIWFLFRNITLSLSLRWMSTCWLPCQLLHRGIWNLEKLNSFLKITLSVYLGVCIYLNVIWISKYISNIRFFSMFTKLNTTFKLKTHELMRYGIFLKMYHLTKA